jgi:cobalt/nickel transport system permease protein
MQVDFFDRYSRGTSPVHRIDAARKLVLMIVFAIVVIATPDIVALFFDESSAVWFFLGAEAWLILAVYVVSGLPWYYLAMRVLAVLPFLVLLAIGVPLSRGFRDGWSEAAQLLARSLLAALDRLHVPRLFISILAFMYRYMFVFWDELERMRRAKLSRTFYPSTWWEIRSIARFVGILFVRAFERSERVHAAMIARGWRGDVPAKEDEP